MRRFRWLAVVSVAAGATLGVARAQAQPTQVDPCEQLWLERPQLPDDPRVRTIAVDGFTSSVIVPPDYDARDNTQRYPVLYLKPGGGWGPATGHATYPAYTDVLALSAADDVIVVTSFGGPLGGYFDWQDGSNQRWETMNGGHLVAAVDGAFRTIPDRAHRAVAGESMGGIGAAYLASRYPDVFGAVGVFSPALTLAAGLIAANVVTGPYSLLCHGGNGLGPFGDPITNELAYHAHAPVDLARNLGTLSVYLASGNGVPCELDDVDRFTGIYPAAELLPLSQSLPYDSALTTAGVAHTNDFPVCATHDWPYFNQFLRHFWPQMLAAFQAPPPASFDYRSADQRFTVFDWTFTADPSRAGEFLDVTDASTTGVTLRGSGLTTVTTAPLFAPGQAVRLSDGRAVAADSEGRLTATVSLGAAHRLQQYTAVQRLAETLSLGRYWNTRTITWEVQP